MEIELQKMTSSVDASESIIPFSRSFSHSTDKFSTTNNINNNKKWNEVRSKFISESFLENNITMLDYRGKKVMLEIQIYLNKFRKTS